MKILDNPLVIFYKVYESKDDYSIVLELSKEGTLRDYLKNEGPLEENVDRSILWQIMIATNYLHIHRIAHREIKPENLMFSYSNYSIDKILDFGLSKVFSEN